MLLIWKNDKTGESVNVDLRAPKYAEMKNGELFMKALDKAYKDVENAVGRASLYRVNDDKDEFDKALEDYKVAMTTLLAIAHSGSDKGIYLSYTEDEYKDLLHTIEDGLSKRVDVFSKIAASIAQKKNGLKA